MADTKISALPAASAAAGANELAINEAGTSKKLTVTQLQTYFGALLGITSYLSGGPYTTTSTTPVDADATNLAVTIVAPASGNALFRLSALVQASPSGYHRWGIRIGAGAEVVGDYIMYDGTTGRQTHVALPLRVSGLTPGASYTYKWTFNVTNGSHTATIAANNCRCYMEVWALP